MRRRPGDQANGTPAELRRFDPADWGEDDQAPVRWYAARDAWRDEHGTSPDQEGPCPTSRSTRRTTCNPHNASCRRVNRRRTERSNFQLDDTALRTSLNSGHGSRPASLSRIGPGASK